MQEAIKFKLTGYDPFIDYIKAYAILCVLLGHTLLTPWLDKMGYALWAGMQVPLFVLIQSFHVLKKDRYRLTMSKIWKMTKRIIIPFVVVEVFIALFLQFIQILGLGEVFSKRMLNWGGVRTGFILSLCLCPAFLSNPRNRLFPKKT